MNRRWDRWQPDHDATLVYVIRGSAMLLIRKKRGLGSGKINGPGGRVEPGEAVAVAAVREVQEELHVTPLGVEKRGEVWFQVRDGVGLRIHVFTASDLAGEPEETAEAVPQWVAVDAVPYDEMWADDRLWMPMMLRGASFVARVEFEGDRLVSHEVDVVEPPSTSPPGEE